MIKKGGNGFMTQVNPLEELNEFWKRVFSSEDPWSMLDQYYEQIPEKERSNFLREFLPQPFYGYLHREPKKDILLLLINPGQVRPKELNNLLPNGTNEEQKEKWNEKIRIRHLTWNEKEYHTNEEWLIKNKDNWREVRRKQAVNVYGEFGFLHTIEFFPFHSKDWKLTGEKKQRWIYDLEPTKLAINAIKYIAEQRKVKHIVGIGKPWVNILSHYKNMFELVETHVIPGEKRASHRFYKFNSRPQGIPIVIYISGSGGINLPSDDEAVQTLRRLSRNQGVIHQ